MGWKDSGKGCGKSAGFGGKGAGGAPEARLQGGPGETPGALGGSFVPRPTGVLIRPPNRAPFDQPPPQLVRPPTDHAPSSLANENGGEDESEAKRPRLLQGGSVLSTETSSWLWSKGAEKEGTGFGAVRGGSATAPGPGFPGSAGPLTSLQTALQQRQPLQQPLQQSLQQPLLQLQPPLPHLQQLQPMHGHQGPPPPYGAGSGQAPMLPQGLAPQAMPQQGLLPAVPVFLAPATRGIVPVSSKRKQPGATPAAVDQNRQIAMQFLSADRDTQTQMLKDPQVARAILHTLGDSTLRVPGLAPGMPAGPAPPPALPGLLGAPGPPPPGLPPPGASAAPPALLAAAAAGFAPGVAPAWAGRMVLTRSMGKHLNTHATLLYGKVQMVELALRTAAGSGGVLNISHRVPFDDLARRSPGAVLVLAPLVPHEQAQYDEYVRYFRAKMRAGVARLDEVDALYIIPPAEETAGLLKSLEAAGVPPLPRNMLLGVVAATPGPPTGAAAAVTPAAGKARPAAAVAAAAALGPDPTARGEAAPPGPEEKDPRGQPPSKGLLAVEKDPRADTVKAEADVKAHLPETGQKEEEPGDDDASQDMSKEALLDLFSNPDLIKSLQEDNEPLAGD